jgi:hypothetical protein
MLTGTDEPLKSFLKLWTKKLKTADKAETRMSSSAVTRGRKRRTDVEWIRCCIPSCGKWRAVVRTIDTQQMLARLCKGGKWGSKGLKWYCHMFITSYILYLYLVCCPLVNYNTIHPI